MRYASGFCRFWYDFVVGDDWRIAAGVAGVLGAGAVLVATDALDDTLVVLVVGAALVGVVVASVVGGGIAAARAAAADVDTT
jgi:curli biogenesis system outer membrane secretion channel CsgG